MMLNTISRTRGALGTLLGQLRSSPGGIGAHIARRRLCTKPQETQPQPATPVQSHAEAVRPAYKMPGHRPTENDKRVLIWSGRFKSRDQIPEFVSHEMIDASRNKLRVKACYIMIGLTVLSCVAMVILGKQAAGRNESLLGWNMERKARWREEAGRESTVAAEKAP